MPRTTLPAIRADDDGLTTDQRLRILEAGHRLLAEQIAEAVAALREGAFSAQRVESRMGILETELAANSETTTEVREILATARAGLKVLGGLGTAARWVGYLAAAATAVYALWYTVTHGGKPPGGG